MNTIKLMLVAAAASVSMGAIAAEPSDTTREQRMNDALQDYHSSGQANGGSRGEGPAARTEDKMKRGAHKTGEAIKHGATKAGHAIERGAHKTGEAIHHADEKMKGSSDDAPKN